MAIINQLYLPIKFSGMELLFFSSHDIFISLYSVSVLELPFYRYRDKYAPADRRARHAPLSLAA
jgi:hypothetical protein